MFSWSKRNLLCTIDFCPKGIRKSIQNNYNITDYQFYRFYAQQLIQQCKHHLHQYKINKLDQFFTDDLLIKQQDFKIKKKKNISYIQRFQQDIQTPQSQNFLSVINKIIQCINLCQKDQKLNLFQKQLKINFHPKYMYNGFFKKHVNLTYQPYIYDSYQKEEEKMNQQNHCFTTKQLKYVSWNGKKNNFDRLHSIFKFKSYLSYAVIYELFSREYQMRMKQFNLNEMQLINCQNIINDNYEKHMVKQSQFSNYISKISISMRKYNQNQINLINLINKLINFINLLYHCQQPYITSEFQQINKYMLSNFLSKVISENRFDKSQIYQRISMSHKKRKISQNSDSQSEEDYQSKQSSLQEKSR